MSDDANHAEIVAPRDPLVGREVGGYVIELPLGEGGMGLVYQARHPFLDRRFAIKVLRPEFATDQQLSSNFVREAQTLSGLKHPHIIDIVGFGPLDAQRQFMVMEFLEGRTLEEELQEQGRLLIPRMLSLADQILDALEAAHSIDVIHRDLKPSNVFLARVSGGTEVVKLLDFGLAKLQPQVLAAVEQGTPANRSVIAGTPEYIAPEQAQGARVSNRSDLYSFGVMLFEMLTGQQPFRADADATDRIAQLLQQHASLEAPDLGDSLTGLPFPEDLERLVAELLRKNPLERPASAREVRQRLKRVQRELQREETRQSPNPLLAAASPPEPEPILLVPPRGLLPLPVLVGMAVLLLLGPALWWLSRPPPALSPVPAAELLPVAPAAPASRPADDELTPLRSLPAPLVPTAPRPAAKRAMPPLPPIIAAPLCEPTERWRTAAHAHLQELQQLAAARAVPGVWERFEQAEGPLSNAVGAAATGAECAAVERQIQQLAKELSR